MEAYKQIWISEVGEMGFQEDLQDYMKFFNYKGFSFEKFSLYRYKYNGKFLKDMF